MRALAAIVVALFAFVVPGVSAAAGLRTEVSAREVQVGETVTVEVTAVVEGNASASSPTLTVEGPGEVFGPSLRTQRRITMHNFDFRSEESIVASWTVTPTGPGTLVIGPPRLVVGQQQLQGDRIVVTVRPADPNAPPRSPSRGRPDPFSFDPFDVWGGGGRRPLPGLPEAPADLTLPHAPDGVAFLWARVSTSRVVVGEPLVLEIFAYGSRGPFAEVSPIEPTTAGFLSYPIVENSAEQPRYGVEIDGRTFLVQKLREIVLVPLETGTQVIGSMQVVLRGNGRNYPARGSQFGMALKSRPLEVEVVEPPAEGRPANYVLGHVGTFRLKAELSPMKSSVGEHVELRVTVRGHGSLPSELALPGAGVVAWDKPTLKGDPSFEDGVLGGTRTFIYTGQTLAPGSHDLGPVELTSWDPEAKRYVVARAKVGTLEVAPATSAPAPGPDATPNAGGPAASSPESAALELRRRLKNSSASERHPPRSIVLGSAVLPLGTLVLLLLGQLIRTLTKARRNAGPKGDEVLARGLRAAKGGDVRSALVDLERALYAGIERGTGLRARAVLREHLARELVGRGVDPSLARELEALATEITTARFETPLEGSAASPTEHQATNVLDLGRRTERALRSLRPRNSKRGAASAALLVLVVLASPPANAAEPAVEAQFERAVGALDAGDLARGLAELEALADSGVVHRDISFNRGIAYLRRASSPLAKDGDLGQAAAAFREALAQDPDDTEAERGLEEARLAIARRSAKSKTLDAETSSLGMRVLLGLDPWLLVIASAIASVVTAAGLLLAGLGAGRIALGGRIAAAIGAALLLPTLAAYFGAEGARSDSTIAVVVATRAPLLDESGRALRGQPPLEEGAEVRIVSERGRYLELELGSGRSWIERRYVRLLAERGESASGPRKEP